MSTPLPMAAGLVAAVLTGRGLVAQAELQAAIASLESGIVERALQLRRVLAQHRQRFRFLDRQMRGDLAVAVDVDTDIDAAKLGGVEPDFEAALAALRRHRDLQREAVQRHRRRCRRGNAQLRHCGGGGGGLHLRLLDGICRLTGIGGFDLNLRRSGRPVLVR
jgi:hypothetical protein